MLEEVGCYYETILLDYNKAEHKEPGYLAVNPMGKIPAIKHNAVVITEVAAICLYLADRFPQAQMAPSIGDDRRGSYLRWILISALEFVFIENIRKPLKLNDFKSRIKEFLVFRCCLI